MGSVEYIKKRNGQTVAFDSKKITAVMKKAFAAQNVPITEDILEQMTHRVVAEVSQLEAEGGVPHVEQVQDIVERTLMERGYFGVAKHYILYRFEHTKERQEEVKEKIEEQKLFVTKRDGKKELFMIEKLRSTVMHFTQGIESAINVDHIIEQSSHEVYDGITTREVARVLIMVTRSMIERDPAYSMLAARLLNLRLRKEAIGVDAIDFNRLEAQYAETFGSYIHHAVEQKKLDERMLSFDLVRLGRELRPERDDLLKYMGLQTLNDRYFIRDAVTKHSLETPQYMWMRIAMGLALGEEQKEERALSFYNMMSTLRFVPSTPTLFHAGTPHPQLSSCYLNTVVDDLDNIFKVYGDNAQLSKWAGGIGTDWSDIRGTGALIKTAGIYSQGVIPFLKIANDVTVAINRSGRRRGAACVYLECWHYDFEDFLELRKNTGDERRRTHDMNTAAWIPDLFMKRVREDGPWTLFSPDEVPNLHHIYGGVFEEKYKEYEAQADRGEIKLFKRVKARDLWKKHLSMLYETGHPWVTFKDPSNIRSPQDHVGVVHNSNLCTEITLNNSKEETAVCNLGSVNFANHITDGRFDEEKVKETVGVAMRMLDNVIDLNFYPTKETRVSNMRHRPVGLGIMGFQDALYKLGISFSSDACVDFADRSMEIVSYHAIMASTELARERGAYESFKGSKWDRGILPVDTLALLEKEREETIAVDKTTRLDWEHVREAIRVHGMRNSNTMAAAPTATIANISGCIPTIEPLYKNIYVKANISGDFTVVNSYLVEDLKRLGLWGPEMLSKLKLNDGSIVSIVEIPQDLKDKYKETFEIDTHWLLKAAAYRGKWIDQSQSLNIFFRGSSGRELSELYMYAWELGLKTTYYLRTQAASQVEKSTVGDAGTHTRKQVEGASQGISESKDQMEAPAQGQGVPSPISTPAPAPTSALVSARGALPSKKSDSFVSPGTVNAPAHNPIGFVSQTNPASPRSSGSAEVKPMAGPHLHVASEAVCEACE